MPGISVKERPSSQVGHQLAFDAEQDVALLAPVVGDIARRILDQPHPQVAELARPPGRFPGDRRHAWSLSTACQSVTPNGMSLICMAPYRSIVPVRRIFRCSSSTP